MDPILTLGLISIVGGGLFLIILSFIYHCLLAILECIGNTVFSPPKSRSPTFGVEDI
jgi:hypothetical protein